jgi:hypothetical protein
MALDLLGGSDDYVYWDEQAAQSTPQSHTGSTWGLYAGLNHQQI